MASDPARSLKGVSAPVQPRANLDIIDNSSPQKRLRILHRATEIFLDRGFAGANLDEIAIAASVGKAAIYQLFGDKTELFAQCLLEAVGQSSALLRAALRTDLPIEQVLIDFAEQHILRMFRPVCGSQPYYQFARVLLSAAITHPELSRRCLEVFRQEEGLPLQQYFAEMIRTGALMGGEPEFLTEYFFQTIFFTNHVILEPVHAEAYRDMRAHAERTVHLFLYGCSPLGRRATF
jgi:AcrR family transcriptional regulator